MWIGTLDIHVEGEAVRGEQRYGVQQRVQGSRLLRRRSPKSSAFSCKLKVFIVIFYFVFAS
jgi:hypothetical protein